MSPEHFGHIELTDHLHWGFLLDLFLNYPIVHKLV